ncbi:MAG: Ig-like domain repeat protein [Acidobacteriaceae bacterium]
MSTAKLYGAGKRMIAGIQRDWLVSGSPDTSMGGLCRGHRTSSQRVSRLASVIPLTFFLLVGWISAVAQQPLQVLHHHVRAAVSDGRAALLSPLPADQQLHVSIVLPLRNQTALTSLLSRLYDPKDPNYRHFLTVAQFTQQFGPTADDYQAVVAFARSNGFVVGPIPANRLTVPMSGTVAQINRAFHVSMNVYQHPTESRTFYSPDREPSLNLGVAVARIAGLNNYSLPQPMVKKAVLGQHPNTVTGSGPGGSYLASDMRAAYYGGTALTGNGQTVGLFEFNGFDLSDVESTFSTAGQSFNVPINEVLLDGETGAPGYVPFSSDDDTEETLDVVQAIGMAPGLSQVRVYIGEVDADILNSMVSEDQAQQISCSWSWVPDSLTANDSFFQEMAAQGQSFFVASGDDGAFDAAISPYFYPQEDQFVTAVGATTLSTIAAGGNWSSEVVWNDDGSGSTGGTSPDGFGIPGWQTGLANSANGGSATLRNVPDVAMEGDFDNYLCANGTCFGDVGGTSFAAPRWAGFMALVNQQALEANNAPAGGIGFLNSPLYALAQGNGAANDLHDITSGNNDTDNQPVFYNAVPGYDLTTGWGSPEGQNLIDDLAGPQIPGFWLAATQGTISENPGGSASTSINVTDAGDFSGPVNLAVTSQLPEGATASFSPNPATNASTLTVSSTSTATLGTGPITITGTSGTLTASTNVSLAIQTPSFSLTATTVSSGRAPVLVPSVNQGGTGKSVITVVPKYGFTGSVALAVSGLPIGVTAAFTGNPTTSGASLNVSVSASATPGTTLITITGTSGGVAASTTASLTINAPELELTSTGSLSIGQGMSGTINVNILTVDGLNGNVSLSLSGLPSGVTASFSPNPTAPGVSVLTLSASSAVVPGPYSLTVTGTLGTYTSTTTIALGVYVPTFTVNVSGSSTISMGQGMTWNGLLFITDEYGFTGNVSVSVSGLPSGVTASFSQNPVASQSQFTLTVANTTALGQYPLTIVGTSGGQTSTTSITLVIAGPSFTLSFIKENVFLGQGTTSNIPIEVSSTTGFNGNVSFSISGLPSGVTAAFSQSTYSYILTLTVSNSVSPGPYALTITGTSGTLTATATLYMGVYVPTFTLSVPGIAFEVGQGSSATGTVTVNPQNGFTSAVSLSVSGLPNGATASFSPNPTTGSSTMTVTASPTTPVGLFNLTYTGTSGNQTVTTGSSLSVQAPFFVIGGGGAGKVIQGSSTSIPLQVQPYLGFTGSVYFSIAGLPAGVTASFSPNPTTTSSTMTITAGSSALVGVYNLTITGTSGSAVTTTPLQLSVLVPTFSVSSTSAGITLHQGGTATAVLYATSPAPLPSGVTLVASALPSGVTASFSPDPTNASSTMTLSASSAAPLGTSPVTITGTCCGLTASTTIPVTVVGPQTVTSTSLSLTSSGVPITSVNLGTTVTATATVSTGSTSLTTGQVNFCDATALDCDSIHRLGSAQLTSSGTAVLRFVPGIGSHSIKAVFMSSNGNAASASAPSNLMVTASLPTTTTITQAGSVGSYTLTATVTAEGAIAPTGNISFVDSTNSNQQLAQAAVGNVTTTFSMVTAQSPAVGQNPAYVVRADFNADGISDLAVLNEVGHSITILLGKGDGTFQAAPNTLQLSSQGSGPLMAVVGDFNRDGNADLAVVMGNTSTIAVFLGHGDGTFAPAILNSQTAAVSSMLVVADFNGDGIEDLAVENSTSSGSGSVSILLGNGDGTFNASNVVASGISFPADLVEADFNGDGIPDLAFVNGAVASSVVVLLGNGDGTFKTLPAVLTPDYLTCLAVGDFNQDGKPDIFVDAAYGTETLLGNGDGTFSAPASSPPIIGPTPQGIAVADFNGDGKPDVALLFEDVSTVSTLLGNGDGTFGAAAGVPLPAGAEPTSIVAGDWNGDGIPDLAVVNQNLSSVTSLTSLRTQQVTATATNISPVGVGQQLVDAAYSGDSDYTGSISGTIALSGLTSAVLSSSLNPSSLGQSVTFTAQITSLTGTPTGSITFTDGSTTLATVTLNSTGAASMTDSALTVGTHTITATYVPTGSFLASSATLSQQVNPDVAVDVLTANPNPALVGSAVALTATVTATPVGTTPTGTVTFTSNGTNLATVSLVGGVAIYSTSGLPAGTDTLGCTYSGDSNYAPSTCNSASVSVSHIVSTLTVTPSANPSPALSAVTLSATLLGGSAPIGNAPIVFAVDGTNVATATTNAQGVGTYTSSSLSVGQHTVTASFAGSGSYTGAQSTSLSEQIQANPTTTTLSASPNPVHQGQSLSVSVGVSATQGTAAPTGSVALVQGSTTLATATLTTPTSGVVSTATISISSLPAGSGSIQVNYTPADGNFVASSSSLSTVTVDVPDFSIAANPTSLSIESGQSGSSTITVTSLGLFAGSVQLSCGSGLPQYMSCSFTQSTVTLSANGMASSTLTINTKQNPQTALLRSRSSEMQGVLFSLLLPFAFLRLKKNKGGAGRVRHLASLTLAVICLGNLLVSLVGCGSHSLDSTPAGTYTIPIVVSGTSNGSSTLISHTLNYTVVVAD